jgi:hypothetical protein
MTKKLPKITKLPTVAYVYDSESGKQAALTKNDQKLAESILDDKITSVTELTEKRVSLTHTAAYLERFKMLFMSHVKEVLPQESAAIEGLEMIAGETFNHLVSELELDKIIAEFKPDYADLH